jgi:transposase
MDSQCIATVLDLPAFRVTDQVIKPHEMELHLEHRDTYLVCPRCQGCCARIKEGRERCIRDLPMLNHPLTLRLHIRRFACSDCHHRPWEKSATFGDRVKLQSMAGTVSRWFEPIARYIRHRYTNGMTEGFNNKIKLIQRRAFGLRNAHNRKKRILADCART